MFHNQCSNCKRFYGSNVIQIVNSTNVSVDLNISDICPHCHSDNDYSFKGTFNFDEKGNWSRVKDFLKDKSVDDIRLFIEKSKSLNILDDNSIDSYADYLQRFDPKMHSFFLSFYKSDRMTIGVVVFLVIVMGYLYLTRNDDATVKSPSAIQHVEVLK